MKLPLLTVLLGLCGFAAGYFHGGESAPEARGPGPTRSDARLRSTDPALLLASLRKLAKEDPQAFFKELRRVPPLEGLEEIVATAARGLADMDSSKAAGLLNKIPNLRLRTLAWVNLLIAQRDRPLAERLKLVQLAGSVASTVVRQGIIQPGLAKDPEEMLNALRQKEHQGLYSIALQSLGKTRPELMVANLKKDLVSGMVKPGECQNLLMYLFIEKQSPEALAAVSGLIKDHGWREGIYAGPIFRTAYLMGDDRGGVVDAIASLPTVQKNFALTSLPLWVGDPAQAATILNLMDSTELQLQALRQFRYNCGDSAQLADLAARLKSERTRALWQQEQAQDSR